MKAHEHSKLNFNNETIAARVKVLTGLKKGQADLAVIATIRAISEELQTGNPVTLRNVGMFYWRMSSARTIPRKVTKNCVIPMIKCPPRPKLKFLVSKRLDKELKNVTPRVVVYPAKWSTARPFPTATQAQDAAVPSTPSSAAGDASAKPEPQ